MERNIPEILCKIKIIFLPSFFNVIEYLPVHLPYEAKVGGAMQYRWMYPFERHVKFLFTSYLNVEMKSSFCTYHHLWCRFLHHLKKKVSNKARVESSICDAYLKEEISNFCAVYFEQNLDTNTRDLERNVFPNVEENLDGQISDVFSCNIGHTPTKGMSDILTNASMMLHMHMFFPIMKS